MFFMHPVSHARVCFQCRYVPPTWQQATPGHCDSESAFLAVVNILESIIKRTNQQLLLQKAYSTKVLPALLEPVIDQKVRDSDSLKSSTVVEPVTTGNTEHATNTTLISCPPTGAFACSAKHVENVVLHPRLSHAVVLQGIRTFMRNFLLQTDDFTSDVPGATKIASTLSAQGPDSITTSTQSPAVYFVVKDRQEQSERTVAGEGDNHTVRQDDDDTDDTDGADIFYFCVQYNAAVSGSDHTETHASQPHSVTMTVHGLVPPSRELWQEMSSLLRIKCDSITLEHIQGVLATNPTYKLWPADVAFLERSSTRTHRAFQLPCPAAMNPVVLLQRLRLEFAAFLAPMHSRTTDVVSKPTRATRSRSNTSTDINIERTTSSDVDLSAESANKLHSDDNDHPSTGIDIHWATVKRPAVVGVSTAAHDTESQSPLPWQRSISLEEQPMNFLYSSMICKSDTVRRQIGKGVAVVRIALVDRGNSDGAAASLVSDLSVDTRYLREDDCWVAGYEESAWFKCFFSANLAKCTDWLMNADVLDDSLVSLLNKPPEEAFSRPAGQYSTRRACLAGRFSLVVQTWHRSTAGGRPINFAPLHNAIRWSLNRAILHEVTSDLVRSRPPPVFTTPVDVGADKAPVSFAASIETSETKSSPNCSLASASDSFLDWLRKFQCLTQRCKQLSALHQASTKDVALGLAASTNSLPTAKAHRKSDDFTRSASQDAYGAACKGASSCLLYDGNGLDDAEAARHDGERDFDSFNASELGALALQWQDMQQLFFGGGADSKMFTHLFWSLPTASWVRSPPFLGALVERLVEVVQGCSVDIFSCDLEPLAQSVWPAHVSTAAAMANASAASAVSTAGCAGVLGVPRDRFQLANFRYSPYLQRQAISVPALAEGGNRVCVACGLKDADSMSRSRFTRASTVFGGAGDEARALDRAGRSSVGSVVNGLTSNDASTFDRTEAAMLRQESGFVLVVGPRCVRLWARNWKLESLVVVQDRVARFLSWSKFRYHMLDSVLNQSLGLFRQCKPIVYSLPSISFTDKETDAAGMSHSSNRTKQATRFRPAKEIFFHIDHLPVLISHLTPFSGPGSAANKGSEKENGEVRQPGTTSRHGSAASSSTAMEIGDAVSSEIRSDLLRSASTPLSRSNSRTSSFSRSLNETVDDTSNSNHMNNPRSVPFASRTSTPVLAPALVPIAKATAAAAPALDPVPTPAPIIPVHNAMSRSADKLMASRLAMMRRGGGVGAARALQAARNRARGNVSNFGQQQTRAAIPLTVDSVPSALPNRSVGSSTASAPPQSENSTEHRRNRPPATQVGTEEILSGDIERSSSSSLHASPKVHAQFLSATNHRATSHEQAVVASEAREVLKRQFFGSLLWVGSLRHPASLPLLLTRRLAIVKSHSEFVHFQHHGFLKTHALPACSSDAMTYVGRDFQCVLAARERIIGMSMGLQQLVKGVQRVEASKSTHHIEDRTKPSKLFGALAASSWLTDREATLPKDTVQPALTAALRAARVVSCFCVKEPLSSKDISGLVLTCDTSLAHQAGSTDTNDGERGNGHDNIDCIREIVGCYLRILEGQLGLSLFHKHSEGQRANIHNWYLARATAPFGAGHKRHSTIQVVHLRYHAPVFRVTICVCQLDNTTRLFVQRHLQGVRPAPEILTTAYQANSTPLPRHQQERRSCRGVRASVFSSDMTRTFLKKLHTATDLRVVVHDTTLSFMLKAAQRMAASLTRPEPINVSPHKTTGHTSADRDDSAKMLSRLRTFSSEARSLLALATRTWEQRLHHRPSEQQVHMVRRDGLTPSIAAQSEYLMFTTDVSADLGVSGFSLHPTDVMRFVLLCSRTAGGSRNLKVWGSGNSFGGNHGTSQLGDCFVVQCKLKATVTQRTSSAVPAPGTAALEPECNIQLEFFTDSSARGADAAVCFDDWLPTGGSARDSGQRKRDSPTVDPDPVSSTTTQTMRDPTAVGGTITACTTVTNGGTLTLFVQRIPKHGASLETVRIFAVAPRSCIGASVAHGTGSSVHPGSVHGPDAFTTKAALAFNSFVEDHCAAYIRGVLHRAVAEMHVDLLWKHIVFEQPTMGDVSSVRSARSTSASSTEAVAPKNSALCLVRDFERLTPAMSLIDIDPGLEAFCENLADGIAQRTVPANGSSGGAGGISHGAIIGSSGGSSGSSNNSVAGLSRSLIGSRASRANAVVDVETFLKSAYGPYFRHLNNTDDSHHDHIIISLPSEPTSVLHIKLTHAQNRVGSVDAGVSTGFSGSETDSKKFAGSMSNMLTSGRSSSSPGRPPAPRRPPARSFHLPSSPSAGSWSGGEKDQKRSAHRSASLGGTREYQRSQHFTNVDLDVSRAGGASVPFVQIFLRHRYRHRSESGCGVGSQLTPAERHEISKLINLLSLWLWADLAS